MEQRLPRQGRDARRHRPPRAPQRHLRDDRREQTLGGGARAAAGGGEGEEKEGLSKRQTRSIPGFTSTPPLPRGGGFCRRALFSAHRFIQLPSTHSTPFGKTGENLVPSPRRPCESRGATDRRSLIQIVAPYTGSCATPVELSLPSVFSLVPRVLAGCIQSLLLTAASRRYL